MLVRRQHLRLTVSLERWLDLAGAMPKLDLVSGTAGIALPGGRSAQGPADRMIVATAREMGAAFLTRRIRACCTAPMCEASGERGPFVTRRGGLLG